MYRREPRPRQYKPKSRESLTSSAQSNPKKSIVEKKKRHSDASSEEDNDPFKKPLDLPK
jgi:hypothetical protein